MGKLIVVENDAVQGTDKHPVAGTGTIPGPPGTAAYSGTGDYQYAGKMTANLSTLVKIGGKPVALVTSQSSLNSGAHLAPSGSNFNPPAPVPIPASLNFVPPVIGTGIPNAASGSALLTVGGVKVLLDADKIDTCDGTGSANSTVTASGQTFVNCSA